MAINKPVGDNKRIGMVKERSQVLNPKIQRFVKRNKETGRFMDVKSDSKKFKGVRKEGKND
ncbi:MAG: hypothetical protein PHU42_03430 [Patescibacteria group bacterium]|nr:hypothetical protein [Patescibacteria group bacterium]